MLQLMALTPLFGNGAGAHGIGKISGVLTKIGKFDIVLMYEVSNARLIPIIKLSYCTMRKGRERSKCYNNYILLFCDEKKMENQKKKKKIFFFFVKLGIFFLELGKKTLFDIGNGAEFRPQNRVIESPATSYNLYQNYLSKTSCFAEIISGTDYQRENISFSQNWWELCY